MIKVVLMLIIFMVMQGLSEALTDPFRKIREKSECTTVAVSSIKKQVSYYAYFFH